MSPCLGKIRRWAPRGHPRPQKEATPRGGRQRPLRPAAPALRAAVGARSARGRPGPRAVSAPQAPLGLPGLPHRSRAQGPGAGGEPRWRRREALPEESPCPQGQSRLRTPLTHLQKKASRRPSAQRHLQGRDSGPRGRGAPRLCSNFRREAPSPLARTDARHPAALGVQAPPLGCHQAPGPAGSHLRAGAACAPPGAHHVPRIREPLGAHSPPTHSATSGGWRPAPGGSQRKTGLGALRVTLTHPFPEETPAERGRWGGSRGRPH